MDKLLARISVTPWTVSGSVTTLQNSEATLLATSLQKETAVAMLVAARPNKGAKYAKCHCISRHKVDDATGISAVPLTTMTSTSLDWHIVTTAFAIHQPKTGKHLLTMIERRMPIILLVFDAISVNKVELCVSFVINLINIYILC